MRSLLREKAPHLPVFYAGASALSAAAFIIVILLYPADGQNRLFIAGMSGVIMLLIQALLIREGLITDLLSFSFSALLAGCALLARLLPLELHSADYDVFLYEWVEFYRSNGGFSALMLSIGDYNFPYLYFLAFFSYLNINQLYLIKALSIIFDILLALYAMRLIALSDRRRYIRFSAYFAVLLLPTVWMNSAWWAQCDSIYTAFMLMALYYGLKRRGWLSVAFAAIAFSFKLQSVFLLPIYMILLIARRVNWKQLFAFPAVYLLTVFPAVFAGRRLIDALTIYIHQTEQYSDYLTLNAPSIFAFVDQQGKTTLFSALGILAAFVFLLFLFLYAFLRRNKLDDGVIVLMAGAMALFVPFFLPSMHERYFYLADIMTLVCAFSAVRLWPAPVLVEFGSWTGYHAYLLNRYIADLRIGALAYAAAGALLLRTLFIQLEKREGRGILDHISKNTQ